MLTVLLLSAGIAAADTAMPFSQLPLPVQTSAKKELKGARILGAGSEMDGGRMTYEVQTKLNGKSRDLSFDANGNLLEIEQQVDLDNLPAKAKAALQARVKQGKIERVESVTAGKSVSYEATIMTQDGRRSEIAVNKDGSPRHE